MDPSENSEAWRPSEVTRALFPCLEARGSRSEASPSVCRGGVPHPMLPVGPCWGAVAGGAEKEGSWPAQPCRKQSVCAPALAEAGYETSCPSFQSEGAYDVILPRATANSQVTGSANSTLRAEDMYAAQSHQAATPLRDGKNSQVFRNPYVWD